MPVTTSRIGIITTPLAVMAILLAVIPIPLPVTSISTFIRPIPDSVLEMGEP